MFGRALSRVDIVLLCRGYAMPAIEGSLGLPQMLTEAYVGPGV